MPELPEVETVTRDLRAEGLVGRRITGVRIYWPRTVAGPSVAAFERHVRGARITEVSRRGKYIVIRLDNDRTLLIHLRMTGQLSFAAAETSRAAHEHVVLTLDDGRTLRYRDPRKFGRWELVRDPEVRLRKLGPEPLSDSFRSRDFIERLARRKGMLKPLLLNQHFLAGLGNIYVDEALWDAGLHPRRLATTLSDEDRLRLYRSIRKILRRGICASGTTLGNGSTNFYSVAGRRGRNQDALRVFRRHGEPCPRCKSPIARLQVAQRSSHVCAACQPLPGKGAGRRRA